MVHTVCNICAADARERMDPVSWCMYDESNGMKRRTCAQDEMENNERGSPESRHGELRCITTTRTTDGVHLYQAREFIGLGDLKPEELPSALEGDPPTVVSNEKNVSSSRSSMSFPDPAPVNRWEYPFLLPNWPSPSLSCASALSCRYFSALSNDSCRSNGLGGNNAGLGIAVRVSFLANGYRIGDDDPSLCDEASFIRRKSDLRMDVG